MNSYAIYRIAETLRVLFFMTLAILIFNFYPLTAVMIVMLALLNDGAILSIAYDNVHYKNQPEAWNMRMVLGISTVLGIIGVVSAFGLFYLGERVFHLDRPHIQTLMYLKLSVAGHLTIFLTRTRGPFWSIRPARILWIAVLGTQIVATLIAVYGLFMTPLGWGWALFVWGYALAWFLLNDRVKLLAYRIFDRGKGGAKPEAKSATEPEAKTAAKPGDKTEAKPEAAAEPKPETGAKPDAKAESKPEAKAEPKAETKAKAPADLTPQIAKRAYEIYEQRSQKGDLAAQDWEQATRDIGKSDTRAEPNPEAAAEPKPEAKAKPDAKAAPNPEAIAEPKPEAGAESDAKAAPKPEAKDGAKPGDKTEAKPGSPPEPGPEAGSKPDAKAEPKPEAKVEPKAETKAKTPADLTAQLVKRVHKLYEDLGREEVRAVEDWEKTERESRKADE
jgi:H+-transporting ATPase